MDVCGGNRLRRDRELRILLGVYDEVVSLRGHDGFCLVRIRGYIRVVLVRLVIVGGIDGHTVQLYRDGGLPGLSAVNKAGRVNRHNSVGQISGGNGHGDGKAVRCDLCVVRVGGRVFVLDRVAPRIGALGNGCGPCAVRLLVLELIARWHVRLCGGSNQGLRRAGVGQAVCRRNGLRAFRHIVGVEGRRVDGQVGGRGGDIVVCGHVGLAGLYRHCGGDLTGRAVGGVRGGLVQDHGHGLAVRCAGSGILALVDALTVGDGLRLNGHGQRTLGNVGRRALLAVDLIQHIVSHAGAGEGQAIVGVIRNGDGLVVCHTGIGKGAGGAGRIKGQNIIRQLVGKGHAGQNQGSTGGGVIWLLRHRDAGDSDRPPAD